ncbi:endo-1,4-beta-xylanase [Reticulibacter mediterranei]|uniref:Endo-1,4-beta-xylanase n=1 Tax=Reticulibacter mediterranei TaxID=2778369 RepID=A0A8J3N6D6_9CHLR|nr:alpha/beta hydrolase [Reticulibacter mediterranei]GHO97315.1 endo-1,4-beta-xylanase [Reticulibacter mediterranei]
MQYTKRLEIVPIWPEGVLERNNEVLPEQETLFSSYISSESVKFVRNVSQPTLLAYLPDPTIANGSAVLVCPGGCFAFLPIEIEGEAVARWLNKWGVAVFVLKYRLSPTAVNDEEFLQQFMHIVHDEERMKAQAPVGIIDGKQALKVLRERAHEWGVDPERIGVLGFSGGGVISLALATHYDAQSRPSFAASLYSPVWQALTVPEDAPPLFIALAGDDMAVPDGNMPLYSAWKAANRPVELHIYARGGHAFGMQKQGLTSDHWIEQFGEWLRLEGFLKIDRDK